MVQVWGSSSKYPEFILTCAEASALIAAKCGRSGRSADTSNRHVIRQIIEFSRDDSRMEM